MHIDHIEKLKGERSAESFSMKKFDRHLQPTSFLANFVGKGVVPASKFQARRNFLTAQFFFRKVHSCNGLPYDCISSGSRIFLRVWFPQVGGLRIPKLYNAQPMFPDFFFFFLLWLFKHVLYNRSALESVRFIAPASPRIPRRRL